MIFKKHLDSNKVSSEWTNLVYGESIFKRWLRHLNFSELRHSTIYVSLSNICLQYIFITWTNHVDEIFLVLSSLTVGFGISQKLLGSGISAIMGFLCLHWLLGFVSYSFPRAFGLYCRASILIYAHELRHPEWKIKNELRHIRSSKGASTPSII